MKADAVDREHVFSLSAVARRLHVSDEKVQELVDAGVLTTSIRDREVLVTEADLERFINGLDIVVVDHRAMRVAKS